MRREYAQKGAIAKNPPGIPFSGILLLYFLSGLFALVYEVLWMKELGLLFGNTAFAAATTLTAFFSGLASGGYFWGQRASHLSNPLQTYGLLEIAVALSVIGYFQILDAYHVFYPALFELFGAHRWGFIAAKFVLSMAVLFPAAFFIGGTLPVITQTVVRNSTCLGRRVSILYAVNTLGAATGSLLAGFYLPRMLGYSQSYAISVACTATIGVLALMLARRASDVCPFHPRPASIQSTSKGAPLVSLSTIRALAFMSGFGTLSLEVLWTRMFAQVLQNSVYTFATILSVFLLALSLGSLLSNRLMRSTIRLGDVLSGLLISGALLAASTPFVFNDWTGGLGYIGAREGWAGYLFRVLSLEVATMALPIVALGAVFPFLLRLAEPYCEGSGRMVGHLVALNTLGSISGSLTAGFLLLPMLGLWAGIRMVCVLYLLAAFGLASASRRYRAESIAIPMLGIVLLVSVLDPSRLPRVRIDPVDEEESLLEVWESSSGTVAVVRRRDSLEIKVNNYYTLGGSGSRELEEVEGYLPVLLHSRPASAFFLGLGTGISAGAVLRFPLERVVVAELIPEVVDASRKYFTRFNHRLFYDPRVDVITDDARNLLSGNTEQFDLVVADLFIPWRSGAGSLYSLEHYRNVRARLKRNGAFMQWLPAFQLSRAEFGSIVRTLLEVFPQLTLWRGDFSSRKPVLGLLAHADTRPLAADALVFTAWRRGEMMKEVPILAHYVGNLGMSRQHWQSYPVNSDDKPVIEFQAPITQRQEKIQMVDWMTGVDLIEFMEALQTLQPPETDPYLRELKAGLRALPKAGLDLHRSRILRQQGRLAAANDSYARYQELARRAREAAP